MTLIKSISGIRGTIGGKPGQNLTPPDIVRFASGYAQWIQTKFPNRRLKVVIGRDARISGEIVSSILTGSLMGCGIDIIDVGLCTTPGVEMAVTRRGADGGIILTASHNPKQWNALKLLDEKGEFLNADSGAEILRFADEMCYAYATIDHIGKIIDKSPFEQEHIDAVLALPLVDVESVRAKKYKIVVDGINSVGGIVLPKLLREMGVEVIELNCEPTGEFEHNPEPLPENLKGLSELVVSSGADLGVVVDPDADRLALVCEDGTMFGEEYTLVAVSDYILSLTPGSTVSNLSSTRALMDVTKSRGQSYSAAPVGEVNVVEEMKRTKAVIGGEGNGGIIYPELHYGRDALVGIALFLTHFSKSGKKASDLRNSYPDYYISKNKIALTDDVDTDIILGRMADRYRHEKISTIDGLKIDFEDGWVHLRKSNTEPIIRVYSEDKSAEAARNLAAKIIGEIKEVAGLQ